MAKKKPARSWLEDSGVIMNQVDSITGVEVARALALPGRVYIGFDAVRDPENPRKVAKKPRCRGKMGVAANDPEDLFWTLDELYQVEGEFIGVNMNHPILLPTGKLICIDADFKGRPAGDAIHQAFKDLKAWAVKNGHLYEDSISGQGYHIWLTVPTDLEIAKLKPIGKGQEIELFGFSNLKKNVLLTGNRMSGALQAEPVDLAQVLTDAGFEFDLPELPPAVPERKFETTGQDVVDAFNASHDTGAALEGCGYYQRKGSDFVHINSTSGMPGVKQLPDGRYYSHHSESTDPLSSARGKNQPISAFDVFATYQHRGDYKQAIKEAAEMLGLAPIKKSALEAFTIHEETTDEPSLKVLQYAEFAQAYRAKSYLIENIIEEGRLYTLTAPTGTGKTAIALWLAERIARGESFNGLEITQAGVLFLAGENPDDVRTRAIAQAEAHGVDMAETPLYFIEGAFNLGAQMEQIKALLLAKPEIKLVVIDTLQAFFMGDDSNSNEQMKAMAMILRRICQLGVAVIVPAHPIKNPSRERNEPYGGGSFVNEIDGNLAIWNTDGVIDFYWCKKFRGNFEPFSFELFEHRIQTVQDAAGKPIDTILARIIDDQREKELFKAARSAEDDVIVALSLHNGARTQTDLARAAGLLDAKGQPQKMKVKRILAKLMSERLVMQNRNGYHLTTQGRDQLKYVDASFVDENQAF
jgi:hypothetical protein